MIDALVVLAEAPPVEVSTSGQVWSRACPHCDYRLLNVLGPTLLGDHWCRRDGVVRLVVWATP